jgi:peptide/nickel transport system substrate-binding protein
MVGKWPPDDRLTLEPNPNCRREGYPRNDGAKLIGIASPNTRVAMMLSGGLDAAHEIPWVQMAEMQANAGVEMPQEPSTVIYVGLLNNGRPPFDDIKVRQAAAMALDTTVIAGAITFGAAMPANSTMPDALKYHNPEPMANGFDLAAAKAAIAQSGYDGREIAVLASSTKAARASPTSPAPSSP